MGQIQDKLNQTLAQASIAGGVVKHAVAETKQAKIAEQKKQADIAATEEQQTADKEAYRNDTVEAAIAISAHEKFDPVIKDGKTLSQYSSEELSKLDENDVKTLAKAVEDMREGKLTEDRISNIKNAKLQKQEADKTKAEYDALFKANEENRSLKPKEYWEKMGMKKGEVDKKLRQLNPKNRERDANIELKKAYDSFRELNNRIAASRELKFDISAAEAKLNQLRGGKK